MSTPNNINPNGVSDGDKIVVPQTDTLNPNGGNEAARTVESTTNSTNVGVPGRIEPTHVEVRSTTQANPQAERVVVEDSVTHQAGEGVTAGMAPSMETPDIFDNSPQAAVKTQTADQQLVDDKNVKVIPQDQTVVVEQSKTTNGSGIQLETLPDGSVDIPREHDDHD